MLVTTFSTNAYSLFLLPLQGAFGASRAAASLPYALAMLSWGALQPMAGAWADSRGTRPVILGGIILMALGFIVMGLAQGLWQVDIGFGILVGLANAACGTIVFSLLIAKWFPGASRASAVGLSQAAVPASPVVMTSLLFPVIAAFGWRFAALGLALLLLVVSLPLAWLGVRDPGTRTSSGPIALPQGGWREALPMLRFPPLRNLFIARIACGFSALMIGHLVAAALEFGFTAADGAFALIIYGATGAVGSIVGGLAADRWGRVPTLVATYFIRGVGTLALALFTINSAWLFFLAVAFATGPIYATVSVNNVQVFELAGAKRAGFLLGMSLVLHQIAAFGGPIVAGLVFDWTGTYRVSFFLLAVVLLLATIPAARTGQPKLRVPTRAAELAADA